MEMKYLGQIIISIIISKSSTNLKEDGDEEHDGGDGIRRKKMDMKNMKGVRESESRRREREGEKENMGNQNGNEEVRV